ncbi:MAG: beta-hydroxyacyl-ACP dehydratase [Myxococcales bacterium]|nr:MAG: beta-hydroxyacyl-ACP dehydratase [Myxococcales bacterium]
MKLPELSIEITPTFVVSTAIATRDFQDVHHDKARAIELGSQDIFVNILTSQGLVQRYVTDSLGHDVQIESINIRLGAPAYPGDTLTFSGERDGNTVSVTGAVSTGSHVTGTVILK